MGMTINDETYAPKPMSKEETVESLKTMVFGVQAFERFNAKERETLDKAWNIIDQYENRLKAEKVAMLTEIQLEIKEKDADLRYCGYNLMAVDCIELIQQKINTLKADSEG